MATEKFFGFNEDGALKRLKGRIVRFLDNEDPSGSDKSAIRTSLEVSPDAAGLVQADVGTAPNEIPVNGMLGDMAYQSAEGISVARAEVESTTGTGSTQALTVTDGTNTHFSVDENGKTVIGPATTGRTLTVAMPDNSGGAVVVEEGSNEYLRINTTNGSEAVVIPTGKVGIGTSSPSTNLHLYSNSRVDTRIERNSTSAGEIGKLEFSAKDSASNVTSYVLILANSTVTTNGSEEGKLSVQVAGGSGYGITAAEFTKAGIVMGSGKGIDFGAVASGTGTVTPTTGGLLDDYETGTWTPVFAPDSGSFATATTHVNSAKYTKIGNVVTANCYIRSDGTLDTTGGSGTVQIHGLPFTSAANSSISVSVGYAYGWSAAPAGGYVMGNNNKILLTKRYSTTDGHLIGGSVSDLNTSGGSNNQIMISVTYQTA